MRLPTFTTKGVLLWKEDCAGTLLDRPFFYGITWNEELISAYSSIPCLQKGLL